MSERLIVLLPPAGSALRWRRVSAEGGEVASGVLVGDAALDGADVLPVIAVVPGSSIAMHWVELPAATVAQASAAARLLAADVVAAPIADQHVAAAAAADADGMRAIAITARLQMQDWLDQLARHGIDPDVMIPAPMLLPDAGEAVSTLRSGDHMLARGARLAVEAETTLVEAVIGDRRTEPVRRDLIELAAALPPGAAPINLRQGAFRRAAEAGAGWSTWRRAAFLAAACAAAWVLTAGIATLRHHAAASAAEAEIAAIAARALPDVPITDAQAQIAAAAQRAGGTAGLSGMTSSLFAALEASGSLRLESLRYSADGGLRATLIAPVGASLETVRSRLGASGFAFVEGASRSGDTGQRIDIEVTRL
jgi:general secretion pathway protein L